MIRDLDLVSAHDGFAFGARHRSAFGDRKGGVVVLQEVFGVSPHIEAVMARLAAAGYETIAPSLFDRIERGFARIPNEDGLAEGIAAARATPNAQVVADVVAALYALAPGPKFALGFCFGGVVAWLAAQHVPGVAGAVCFYGRRIIDELDAPLRVPVLMHYGDRDTSIPLSDVATVARRHPAATLHLYPAAHAFCREAGAHFDEASRDLAFSRTLDFLDAIASAD